MVIPIDHTSSYQNIEALKDHRFRRLQWERLKNKWSCQIAHRMRLRLKCRDTSLSWKTFITGPKTRTSTGSQVMISLTSQSRLGYAKYRMRKDGRANKTVMSMYKAKMAALAGIAYKTIRRNMRTSGNFAVR